MAGKFITRVVWCSFSAWWTVCFLKILSGPPLIFLLHWPVLFSPLKPQRWDFWGLYLFLCNLKIYPRDIVLPHRQAVYRSDILLLIQSSTGVQGIKESGEVVGEPPLLRPSHPGRKQVCDFIRILLMDSLINIPVKDGFHPLIQLLEVRKEKY